MARVTPIFLLLWLSACASIGMQTRAVLESPPDIPRQVELKTVPFIAQGNEAHCGPASLAMAMQSAGKAVDAGTIAREIYRAEQKGTLQGELISAGRRRGLLVVQLEGLSKLLQEIAQGHPVIVFENLALSWWPKWHYSVAVGYDLDRQEILQHSGNNPFNRESFNYFERGWTLADSWGLVVLPPTKLAASAGELAHLQGAVGLEKVGFSREAEQVYRNILKKWPTSLGALIAMGNLEFQRKKYRAAVKYLRLAVKNHPEASAAIHNLRVAEKAVLNVSR